MKEHQILYSKEMILAKLSGLKTVTRRPVKPQPNFITKNGTPIWRNGNTAISPNNLKCPYGVPGDRLYTKENFSIAGANPSRESLFLEYCADENFRWVELTEREWEKYDKWKQPSGKKSKLFMFRSLCRFLDEVTEISVERVQSITPVEVWNEGLRIETPWTCYEHPSALYEIYPGLYREAFKELWQSMYEGGEFDWDKNPWVWVIRYKPLAVNQAENQDIELEAVHA